METLEGWLGCLFVDGIRDIVSVRGRRVAILVAHEPVDDAERQDGGREREQTA